MTLLGILGDLVPENQVKASLVPQSKDTSEKTSRARNQMHVSLPPACLCRNTITERDVVMKRAKEVDHGSYMEGRLP